MYLSHLVLKNHPILKDINIDLVNPNTGKPYSVVAFVGENGCGKTTLLNEIFNYEESQYIVDKEKAHPLSMAPYSALYLRQNSLAKNAMKETRKLIDGKDLYPVNSPSNMVRGLKTTNPLTDTKEGLKLLKALNDFEICKLFEKNLVGDVHCSQEVTKVIDGVDHGYDVSKYSSGQQEILLKLKDLKEYYADTDSVLLDEPETSLHPRWQKEIVNLVKLLLTDINGSVPQIFLATHSEKVLESLISRNDALIVRLSKKDGDIKTETINEMDLRLPTPTFSELDYVVFHIPSLDYHNQLFAYFGSFFDKDTSTAIDLKVERIAEKRFGKKNIDEYKKERINTRFNKVYLTKMLPTYIRDFFHHPNEIVPPTEEELIRSVELMRKLIKYMNEQGAKEVEESE